SIATTSHHLRNLKENGLAKSTREGKLMYYSLADEHVYQIVRLAYEHSEE
ncbi:MAG TPA: transcriptional regulator, partial [Solibacillus sp.]